MRCRQMGARSRGVRLPKRGKSWGVRLCVGCSNSAKRSGLTKALTIIRGEGCPCLPSMARHFEFLTRKRTAKSWAVNVRATRLKVPIPCCAWHLSWWFPRTSFWGPALEGTKELWGILLGYNLVRVDIVPTAREAKVEPTRISFVESVPRKTPLPQSGEDQNEQLQAQETEFRA
jgi:hypothetical protein